MNIQKLRDMNLHTVADELERLREFKANVESQKPVYFWKEIGETDWMECHKDWYLKCVDSPEHDTKLLYAKPAPADKPAVAESQEPAGKIIKWIDSNTAICSGEGFAAADIFAEIYLRPVTDDKPLRISEQDAREAAKSYAFYCMSEARGDAGTLADWIGSPEGLALLNKLNADREQVPAVAVPDGFREIVEAVAHIGVDFGYGNFVLSQEHIEKARTLLEAAPSHSQQSAATDAERFCDSHCTWRDHHHDCPSHESEQGGAV